jgi:hypothetical protein
MKELDEVLSSARLIQLKTVLDEMIYQNRLSETERDEILNKAGLKKVDGVWLDELGGEYSNL